MLLLWWVRAFCLFSVCFPLFFFGSFGFSSSIWEDNGSGKACLS